MIFISVFMLAYSKLFYQGLMMTVLSLVLYLTSSKLYSSLVNFLSWFSLGMSILIELSFTSLPFGLLLLLFFTSFLLFFSSLDHSRMTLYNLRSRSLEQEKEIEHISSMQLVSTSSVLLICIASSFALLYISPSFLVRLKPEVGILLFSALIMFSVVLGVMERERKVSK